MAIVSLPAAAVLNTGSISGQELCNNVDLQEWCNVSDLNCGRCGM